MISIAERHKYIKEQLARNGFITVQDIASHLGVTGATIRKDLRILEKQNILHRTHGSATPIKPFVTELSINEKSTRNIEEKQAIAAEAQKLIRQDDAIILTSGSTITAFAEILKPVNTLNVVTPSIGIAVLITERENITVLLLGGEISRNSYSVHGGYAEEGLRNVSCSKLFIGCDGIDFSTGITCASVEEARLTKAMMQACSETVLLSDSSKLGRQGFGKICNVKDVDILITDSGLPSNVRKKLEDSGVKVIIAGE